MGSEPRRPPGAARARTSRRRLQASLLSLALLPLLAAVAITLGDRVPAGAEPGRTPAYVALLVAALAAAAVSVAVSRRISARVAWLEAREARLRTAFEAANVAASLAEGAWLARLEEEERRVSERAAEWREENAELEGFAYAVSHDLRAPLRHVDAFVSLLRQRSAASLDPQGLHHLEAIGGAVERMGTLIDGLLSFLGMRHTELVRASVEVGALVRDLVAELTPQAAGRDVEWRVAVLPRVDADPGLLRRALANLLSNAVKFTRPRAHAVIEIGEGASPGGEVVIFVRDNGVGFDARYDAKLFEVFQRLHRVDEFEGTGIGLAVVRRIVERHGGHVWAKGEPGKGATFFMSLPRSPASRPPAPS